MLLLALIVLLQSARPAPSAPPSRDLFQIRSAFWPNLHHFLFQEAVAGTASTSRMAQTARAACEKTACDNFSDEEKSRWEAALGFYRERFRERDLLFDDQMSGIGHALFDAGDGARPETALPPGLGDILDKTAPIYRKRCWPKHDALNRKWIEAARALEGRHGQEMRERLARAFGYPWDFGPVRVDIVVYAGWAAAYTSSQPAHVTIGSVQESNEGAAALETLYHEASHVRDSVLIDGIRAACAAAQKRPPRDLWHVVLFYAVGESARGVMGPGYAPHVERLGLFKVGEGASGAALVRRHWPAVLSGERTPQQGFASLCGDPAPP